MNLFALVASFGGGIIGAYMGALPAFILTGVIAIAGSVAAMAGGADMTVGFIAFGSYLGPHIAFAGGVAAFWSGWLPMLAVLAVVVFLIRSVWRILSALLSLCVLALFILVLCVIL